MVKITAVCSERGGVLEPSHGFGVILNDHVLFDSCSKDAMAAFLDRVKLFPKVGIVGLAGNPHHVGGFQLLKIPVITPVHDLEVKVGGKTYRVLNFGRENVIIVDDVVISPCGLYTIPFSRLSGRGVKAKCLVGGLGGSSHSPYLFRRVVAELRLMGVRCLVALHTAPQIERELERRFNVYRLSAGSTIDL